MLKNTLGNVFAKIYRNSITDHLFHTSFRSKPVKAMVRTIFDKKAIHRIGCHYKQSAPDR